MKNCLKLGQGLQIQDAVSAGEEKVFVCACVCVCAKDREIQNTGNKYYRHVGGKNENI